MEGVDQFGRRVLAGQAGDELAGLHRGQRGEGDPAGEAAAVELAEGAGQGTADVGVAVRRHHQQRQAGQLGRQVLHEQERGVVGPLQVVEDDERRTGAGQAGQDVRQAAEQVQPFLGRRELQRRRQVGEAAAHPREQPGDLGGGVAEDVGHEGLGAWRGRQRRFQDFHDGDVGGGTGDLVAVADEDTHAGGDRLGGGFLRQAGFADARLPADEHHAARARPGPLQGRRQDRELRHPSDERGPFGAPRAERRRSGGGCRGQAGGGGGGRGGGRLHSGGRRGWA